MKNFLGIILAVGATVYGGAVLAAACVATSLADLAGTSCTIADLSFTFPSSITIGERIGGTFTTANNSAFTFTPLDPTSGVDGFTISGSLTEVAPRSRTVFRVS